MADKLTDEQVYELYEVICTDDADVEATIEVADNLGWTEEEVQDAINRHRTVLGKKLFHWNGEVPVGWECVEAGEEEEAEEVTDKVIHDMVIYGMQLAGFTLATACKKAAEFLKLTETQVEAAYRRHERTY